MSTARNSICTICESPLTSVSDMNRVFIRGIGSSPTCGVCYRYHRRLANYILRKAHELALGLDRDHVDVYIYEQNGFPCYSYEAPPADLNPQHVVHDLVFPGDCLHTMAADMLVEQQMSKRGELE